MFNNKHVHLIPVSTAYGVLRLWMEGNFECIEYIGGWARANISSLQEIFAGTCAQFEMRAFVMKVWANLKLVCPHVKLQWYSCVRISAYWLLANAQFPWQHMSWTPNASKICVSDRVSCKV